MTGPDPMSTAPTATATPLLGSTSGSSSASATVTSRSATTDVNEVSVWLLLGACLLSFWG